MKVLLISLPGSNTGDEPIFPLGIGYLSAVLKTEHEVKAIHYQRMEHVGPTFPDIINSFRPDMVGLTCTTFNRGNVRNLITVLKKYCPNIKVVVGGVHASYLYEQVLNNYGADVVVIAEGEYTILELCRAFESSTALDSVKGIAFKQDGIVVTTPPRETIENLDELPMPDFDFAEQMMRNSGMGFIITSRGCPVRCIFCSTSSYWGQKVRKNSIERVVDKMEHVVSRYGVSKIFFHDDTFNLGTERVKKICTEIMDRKLQVQWGVSCRVAPVSKEMIDIMVAAGCRHICWGIESGSEQMLQRINKKITLEQIRNAFELCRKHHHIMSTGAFAIVGSPGETAETVQETIDFFNSLPLTDHPSLGPLYVLPGTKIFNDLKAQGRIDDSCWLRTDDIIHYTVENSIDTLGKWSSAISQSGKILPFDKSKHFWNNILFGNIPQPQLPIFSATSGNVTTVESTQTERPIAEVGGKKSELDDLIQPEIKNDTFYYTIQKLARDENIKTILEIGSSAGAGSTEAFVTGLQQNRNKPTLFCMEISKPRFTELQKCYSGVSNVKCYNLSSIPLEKFPTEQEVRSFYFNTKTVLNNFPVERVLGWLRQDIEYMKSTGLCSNGIQKIKEENDIQNFDMVLIDGSEFAGTAELNEIYGAKFILLDDINGFKNYTNYKRLMSDSNYRLVTEDWKLRSGFAVFERNDNTLPIHFFTIVLNGQPFIRHHIEVFKQLPSKWHWHIIEGVAELKYDTAWSVQNGGYISEQLHKNGLSNDGTTEYLDELKRQFPDNITIYRKANGDFWDGKLEMVNAPLANINDQCLLWQVDSDELWTLSQIEQMRSLFLQNPRKTSAYFHCYYFVGPKKYVSSLNTWATYPNDWIRVWRFIPGMKWVAHEPPTLVNTEGENVGMVNPFTRDETKSQKITFQHFAYVTEAQVRFKEIYYGYKDAVAHWKRLQTTRGPIRPVDYLPWAKDDAIVDDWKDSDRILLSERLPNSQIGHKIYSSMSVDADTQFEIELRKLFRDIRPTKIIETGTYLGKGTTSIIWRALQDFGIDSDFTTIEVNPEHHRIANDYFKRNGINVRSELGLSLPRLMLPSKHVIYEDFVKNKEFDNIYYDHDETARSELYFSETDFDVPDDLLGKTLERYNFSPDFLLLDSAGHVGYLEFKYVLDSINKPCYIMLDDVYHCKHYKSLQMIKSDSRFEIITKSSEKFGFCIVKYSPEKSILYKPPKSQVNSPKKVLIVRPDSIGDFVIFAGMLKYFRDLYQDAKITIIMQEHTSELAETCPYINEVIQINTTKMLNDKNYTATLIDYLKKDKYDVTLYPVYSRDKIGEFITINSGAKEKIAFCGDSSNLSLQIRQDNNQFYTKLLPSEGENKSELERNKDFLRGLGIESPSLAPKVWITDDDKEFAEDFFKNNNLKPKNTIAVFPAAQYFYKVYTNYEPVLEKLRDSDFNFVILGGKDAQQQANHICTKFPETSYNLAGRTSLRQMAAVISKCRLYLGSDSAGAHIACAVGTPNVVILGGGHFGRFLPYSPFTSTVSLPLDCYGCNWRCRYQQNHCVKDIVPEVVEEALLQTLAKTSGKPRIFLQGDSLWEPVQGQPLWKPAEGFLDVGNFEIITVERRTAETPENRCSFESFTKSNNENMNNFGRFESGKNHENGYLVTAIVSTYNSERFIRDCLEDLENQTIADRLEIIVVNSGSKQNEEAIVREFQSRYDNIKYIRTEERETIYTAWNRAIKVASGKYITNANTDDRHTEDALWKMAKALEEHPDKALVYANYVEVKETNGQMIPVNNMISGEFSRARLFQGECPPSLQPMWRKSVHDVFGYFDEAFYISGDYEFWFRLTQKYDFLYLNELLGQGNIGSEAASQKYDAILSWENMIIDKCYRYALQEDITIGTMGISEHPIFSTWPEVNIWRQQTKAKLEDRQISLVDNIKDTWDFRNNPSPKITIVVVTNNRHEDLLQNLYALNEQNEKNFEVIVVDNGGDLSWLKQHADEFIFELCGIELEFNFGSSPAKNIGTELAKAEYVVFLDDDAVADKNLVRNIVKHFAKRNISGLRGKVLPKNQTSPEDIPANYDLGDQIITTACEVSCLSAFRKDVFIKTGGFDELLFGPEGMELSYRICKSQEEKTKSILYFPDVIVYHDHRSECQAQTEKTLRQERMQRLAWRKDHNITGYTQHIHSLYPGNKDIFENNYKNYAWLIDVTLYLHKNFPEEAVEWAEKAVLLKPDGFMGCFILGSLYTDFGRYDEALLLLERSYEPLCNSVMRGSNEFVGLEFNEQFDTSECYIKTCTQLAQCYIQNKQYDKLKWIYTELLNNRNLVLAKEQKVDILNILKKLDRIPPTPIAAERKNKITVSSKPEQDYLVSAIVSTYNSEIYLSGCLEDLERQTIADKLEIIIVNSGSHENEEAIVHEYQQKYDNIVYIKTERREGIYSAWNRAVKVARGTFLTNANTDDRHRDDALEIMAETLLANPNIALVYGDQIYTDTPNGTFANHHAIKTVKTAEYSHERLLFGCCVGSQPMWHKSLHSELGYFDETLTCAGDWDFWLRVSSKYIFKHIPEFLGLYYYNENGIEHGRKIHSLYERYIVGKRYGNPYISVIPLYTSKDNPLVSVIMPAYNAAAYIAEAIESVLIQNYRNFELIVVDDGSTDNTKDIVTNFKDDKIKYFYKNNGGPSGARNLAIKKAKGQYIMPLDADDMITPDFITRHLAEFEKHPDVDLVYSDVLLIDENSTPIRIMNKPEYQDRKYLIRDLFRAGHPIVPFRLGIRRSVFEKIGFYDEDLLIGEDYDMMRRFIKIGLKPHHLSKPLHLRRMRTDSLSGNFSAKKAKCHFEVIRRFTDTFTYDELFPDVAWDVVAPGIRQLHAKCLTAGTYLALGKDYIKSNAPEYSRTAFDRACSELNDCIKMDPKNQGLQQLLQKSKHIRARYSKAAQQAVTV